MNPRSLSQRGFRHMRPMEDGDAKTGASFSRVDSSIRPRCAAWALCVALLAFVFSAAKTMAQPLNKGQAQGGNQTQSALVGVWQGTTLAICPGSPPNRCNAEEKVKITLVEGAGSKLGGYYDCAYGNANCLNMNETGKVVDVTLTGRLLMLIVLMPDGTSCRFNGRLSATKINGGYSCYSGGGLLERGAWRAERAY
jgi:hypothetical protein